MEPRIGCTSDGFCSREGNLITLNGGESVNGTLGKYKNAVCRNIFFSRLSSL